VRWIMRRVTFTECAILSCAAPPHGGTIELTDLDCDGHNELIVGSSGGQIYVFKNARGEGLPWTSGMLDPHRGTLTLLKTGMFLGTREKPEQKPGKNFSNTVIAAVFAEGQCVVLELGDESSSATSSEPKVVLNEAYEQGNPRVPLNVTAGVSMPFPHDYAEEAAEVLVVGTSAGELCILSFCVGAGNASSAPVKVAGAVASLSRTGTLNSESTPLCVIVGYVDGTTEARLWPSLRLVSARIRSSGRSAGRSTSTCVGLSVPFTPPQPSGVGAAAQLSHATWGMATLAGDLQLCAASLTTYPPSNPDEAALSSNGASEVFRVHSMLPQSQLAPESPLAFVATLPRRSAPSGSTAQPLDKVGSFDHADAVLAASTGNGETILVDLPSVDSRGHHSTCFFDANPLFASPLRAFTAGSFCARAAPADSPTSKRGDPVGNSETFEEPCLIYALASGEFLVFHSLAEQVGFGPIGGRIGVRADSGVDERALIAAYATYRHDEEGSGREATVVDVRTEAAAALRWVAYLPTQDYADMKSEIQRLQKELGVYIKERERRGCV